MAVAGVCRRLGMSRQNFYWTRRKRQRVEVDEELVVQLVRTERQVQPRLGARKLLVVLGPALKEAGAKIGRDRFFGLLERHGLLVPPAVTQYPHTTNSYHSLPVFTNRTRDLANSAPHQVWVSDLTYLRTRQGYLYLSVVTDKVSRMVVGHHCGDTLEASGCLLALEKALAQLPAGARPIHHSDRGSQYCCHQYVNRLREAGLEISMTERDHCAENAMAERMNGILKGEYGLGSEFPSKAVAKAAVEQAVFLYNTRRPHSCLGMRVPAAVHRLAPLGSPAPARSARLHGPPQGRQPESLTPLHPPMKK